MADGTSVYSQLARFLSLSAPLIRLIVATTSMMQEEYNYLLPHCYRINIIMVKLRIEKLHPIIFMLQKSISSVERILLERMHRPTTVI
jgi:hypothetical protein